MQQPFCGFWYVNSVKLGAGLDERLARLVGLILGKVLDEASGQIARLLVPDRRVGIGVARVEDLEIDAGQLGGHFKVEVGDSLGRRAVDRAVQDRVDDAAGVTDGDALAAAVPAGVDEIGLCAALGNTTTGLSLI